MVKATSMMMNQLEAELREVGQGLRTNEWDALVFLAARGPMRPAELLRLTTIAVSPGTLHAILSRLEDRGLVERSPHPRHERGVLYSVTPEGIATIESIWPTVERHLVRRFAVLYTDDELEQLDELTSRI
jgi:DNA-binding MarR family transcriptional regulator